jgi:hypothetical protein
MKTNFVQAGTIDHSGAKSYSKNAAPVMPIVYDQVNMNASSGHLLRSTQS